MSPFALQLGASLVEDDTEANRRKWAAYIVANGILLEEVRELVESERRTAMRFLWMTGGLCETHPELVAPHIAYFFAKRHTTIVPNYDRSLARFFWLAGIPEELEGEATDELFSWLLDPGIGVSTKSYALAALYRLSGKYPELRSELRTVTEDQLDKNTVSFRKQAEKVLRGLEERQ